MSGPETKDAPPTTTLCVSIVGFGMIGRELFRQLQKQAPFFRAKLGVDVRVVAAGRSRGGVRTTATTANLLSLPDDRVAELLLLENSGGADLPTGVERFDQGAYSSLGADSRRVADEAAAESAAAGCSRSCRNAVPVSGCGCCSTPRCRTTRNWPRATAPTW